MENATILTQDSVSMFWSSFAAGENAYNMSSIY